MPIVRTGSVVGHAGPVGPGGLYAPLQQRQTQFPISQSDWPNPIAPPKSPSLYAAAGVALCVLVAALNPPQLRAETLTPIPPPARSQFDPGVNNTILTPVTATTAPFNQDDWPNPVQPGRSQFDPGANGTLRQPVTTPIAQREWPNPTALARTQFDPGKNGALPTPTAVVFPPLSLDSTLPRAAPRGQYDPGTQALPLANPPPALRQASFTRIFPPARSQFDPGENAVLPTPAVVVAPPNNQDDWPNPVTPRRGQYDPGQSAFGPLLVSVMPALTVWVEQPYPLSRIALDPGKNSILPTPSAVVVPATFGQYNWPNPVTAKIQQPYLPPRLAGTAPAPVYTPINQDDWPNPIQPARSQFDPGVNRTLYPAPIITPLPPGQALQPNPTPPARAQFEVGQSAYSPLLISVMPGTSQWGNLPLTFSRAAYDVGAGGIKTVTAPATPPLSQTNWPNPVQPARSQFEVGRNSTLAYGSPIFPVSQDDWPVPQAPRRSQYDPGVNRTIYPQPTIVIPASFGQKDWQAPIRVKIQQPYLPQRVAGPPPPPPVLPNSNYDWPNPQQPRYTQWAHRFEASALRFQTTTWNPVSPVENPGWGAIVPGAGAGWGPVVPGAGAGWSPVIDANGVAWAPVSTANGVIWVQVDETSQAPIGSVE